MTGGSDKQTPTNARRLLVLGLDDVMQSFVQPQIPPGVAVVAVSWLDPIDKIVTAINDAATVLFAWDGKGGRAHRVLAEATKLGRRPDARLHALFLKKTGRGDFPDRQAQALGIVGWIELPGNAFEIARVLHDLGESPDEPDDEQLDAAELAQDARRLQLPFTRAPRTDVVLQKALSAWKEPATAPGSQAAPTLPFSRLVVVHPDESFGAELSRRLTDLGATQVALFATAEEAMPALRHRRHQALIVWCDQQATASWLVLEQLVEARHLATLPILVLVPDKDALKGLAPKLSTLVFDVVAPYDRRQTFLAEALGALQKAASSATSARALLERLRAPLRPAVPPEARRDLDKSDLALQTAKLAQTPGKLYWATLEETTQCLLSGRADEARASLERMRTLQPDSFSTLTLRYATEALAGDRRVVAQGLVRDTLAFDKLTVDRLYRTGALLARWGAWEALADLLDGWMGHANLPQDAQAHYLAGLYYDATGRRRIGLHYLARAVDLDPLRPDLIEGLGRHLLRDKEFGMAAQALKLATAQPDSPWEARIDLAKALVGDRRIRDAEKLIDALAKLSPRNKDVLALQSQLPPGVKAKAGTA